MHQTRHENVLNFIVLYRITSLKNPNITDIDVGSIPVGISKKGLVIACSPRWYMTWLFLSFPTFGYFIKYLTESKKPSHIPSRTTCNHQTFFGNSNRCGTTTKYVHKKQWQRISCVFLIFSALPRSSPSHRTLEHGM